MPTVKKPITLRIDPVLLERVRDGAARDNRSVTNFIETALRKHLGAGVHNRNRKKVASRSLNESGA